jgi:rubrerythrin
MSVAISKKSKERQLLEERLVKCRHNPLEFSNLGRNALKKKVHELEVKVTKAPTEVSNISSDNKEAVSSNKEAKKLEKENNKLKDVVEKLKSDLTERSNFYCWHCGFALKNNCPRCGYGMTDTAYRDIEEDSNEESDEDNAQWEDKDYEDVTSE